MNGSLVLVRALAVLLMLCFASGAVSAEESLRGVLEQMEDLQETLEFQVPRDNSTVRYAGGATATLRYGSRGATWNWPNGKTITLRAGAAGATWLWPNGKTMSLMAGKKGASWYWPDGSVYTMSGPEFSDRELLDVPAFAVKMLRMAVRRGY